MLVAKSYLLRCKLYGWITFVCKDTRGMLKFFKGPV